MEFLLLLLSFLLFSSPATSSNDAVLDGDGDALRRGEFYYAECLLTFDAGGGLRRAAQDGGPCPLTVVKAPFYDFLGEPLTFFPENEEDDIVREGSTQNIGFVAPTPTPCKESSLWKYDGERDRVTTGGEFSSVVGPHYSRFALSRRAGLRDYVYQIKPCPCSIGVERASCRMGCLGTLAVGEERELCLQSNFVHDVIFRKLNPKEPAIRSKAE